MAPPRWFRRVAGKEKLPPDEADWEYVGGYWEARESGVWENCRDVFK